MSKEEAQQLNESDFRFKKCMDILERHLGTEFFHTGQYHASIADAMEEFAASQSLPKADEQWISVEEFQLPEEGIEVVGYSKEWVDEDFNINGTRICFINDGIWFSAKWNNDQDSWHTHSENCCNPEKNDFTPTHWMPLPVKPI